jgi:hypothetical protein
MRIPGCGIEDIDGRRRIVVTGIPILVTPIASSARGLGSATARLCCRGSRRRSGAMRIQSSVAVIGGRAGVFAAG